LKADISAEFCLYDTSASLLYQDADVLVKL